VWMVDVGCWRVSELRWVNRHDLRKECIKKVQIANGSSSRSQVTVLQGWMNCQNSYTFGDPSRGLKSLICKD